MKKIFNILIAIIALTVMAPGHADSYSKRDLDCLAKNIYYEAGNETQEGKVAVGIVTLNRVADGRFSDSICGVVHQRTLFQHTRKVVTNEEVHTRRYHIFDQVEHVSRVTTKMVTTAICQFSWSCQSVAKPKTDDDRWIESHYVAEQLLEGGFTDLQDKYDQVLYFHATTIRPAWGKLKKKVARIGGHIFYAEK